MRIIAEGKDTIAVLDSEQRILSVQDILDRMATLGYEHGITAMIVHAESLGENFFSLKTGYAGEILQKFSNYQMKLGIVGDFSGYTSKPLQDFIRECNSGNRVFFKGSEEEAVQAICGVLNAR